MIETNNRKYVKYFRKRNQVLLLQIVYWYILFIIHI